MEQERSKEFIRGVAALREYLAANFEKYNARDPQTGANIQRFSGPEIADIIRRVELPAKP